MSDMDYTDSFDMDITYDSDEGFNIGESSELDMLDDVEDVYETMDVNELCLDDFDLQEIDDDSNVSEGIYEINTSSGEYDVFMEEMENICEAENEFDESYNSEEDLSLDEFEELCTDDFESQELVTPEILEELYLEADNNPEQLDSLRDLLQSGRVKLDLDEFNEAESGEKTLTREITSESLESRERDIEETLDNYRENLRNYDVSEDVIEQFVAIEREKINTEYDSLECGDTFSNIYYDPMNWESIAETLAETEEYTTNVKDLLVETDEEFCGPKMENIEDESIYEEIDISNQVTAEMEFQVDEEIHTNEIDFAENEYVYDEINDVDQITEEIGLHVEEDSYEEEIEDTEVENFYEELTDTYDSEEFSEEDNYSEELLEELIEQPEVFEEQCDEIHMQDEEIEDESRELNINYDEIYDEIDRKSLEQGFAEINIDLDSERLKESLVEFKDDNWESVDLEHHKEVINDLSTYVKEIIGFDNPPVIEYYNNEKEGDYGGYDAQNNILRINEYMLYNSREAADTVAHELWHAHQHECAVNPSCARDYQYQYNFENYIRPELSQEAYENQLLEAEARAFAEQFKERLEQL